MDTTKNITVFEIQKSKFGTRTCRAIVVTRDEKRAKQEMKPVVVVDAPKSVESTDLAIEFAPIKIDEPRQAVQSWPR